MSIANPYQQYQQNTVQGVSPGELTLMLYDGLVKSLKMAILSLEQTDFNRSHNSLIRAQEILTHLNETLDFQYDLSQNLSALYEFMTRQLMEANAKKDVHSIQAVLELAQDMRDTWQQALQVVREQG